MLTPKFFWVPPVVCGVLAAGCAAGAAWNIPEFAAFQDRFDPGRYTAQEAPHQDEEAPQAERDAADAETEEQIKRVETIMRASAEGTKKILADLFDQ